jgi:hypothetical protein
MRSHVRVLTQVAPYELLASLPEMDLGLAVAMSHL